MSTDDKPKQAQLFLMPTHVAGSVDKRGRVTPGHMSKRRKKIANPPAPAQQRVESNLDKFITSHGGADRMRETLKEMTPEQRAKLIDAMAYVGGVKHDAVLDKLGMREPDPAAQRQALVDRLGRGVAGKFIDEKESAAVLEVYDKDGSQAALDTLRGILRAKKEAAEKQPETAAAESAAAEPAPAEQAPPPAESTGPKEGDTKTEDGIDYVLRDGRWHRVTEAEPETAATAEPEVAAETALPEQPVLEEAPPPTAPPEGPPADEGDDLDPNSPNYRYRDTGYVAGSRKEEAAKMIRRMARDGQRVHATDVDWEELEKNPRQAAELIVKKNIFGDVDWEAMKAAGVDPGAGFIIQKMYAAVAPEPAIDSPLGRKDYASGIDSLRNRLEACKTVADVTKVLEEIQDERDGIILTSEEEAEYRSLTEQIQAEYEVIRNLDATADEMYQRYMTAQISASRLKFDLEKRGLRKWKVTPEMQTAVADAEKERDQLMEVWQAYRQEHGMQTITHSTKTDRGVNTRFEYPYKNKVSELAKRRGDLRDAAQARNQIENPLTRAWNSLGESFNAVINHRRHKGSDAFARHLATVKAGKVKDWAWAEQKKEPRKASKRSTTFQLRVADTFERTGGRNVSVDSTAALKDHFTLREVQSGNWVLDDPNSAKFHVESCAGAFADMADVLGIPDEQVSFNGRLAMAFGARGRGNAGGSAAKAHYEPIERVINLTKMAGGGSVAHEWFHMVDNLVKEATTGVASGVDDWATQSSRSLEDPELKAAFTNLTTAMMSGPHRKTVTIRYTETEERLSKTNMESTHGTVRQAIRAAGSVQRALDHIDTMYEKGAFGRVGNRKAMSQRDTWKTIAAIHHGGNDQREITYEVGPGMSMFALEATHLDQGVAGKYWSATHEMAARAFSSFVQDKLEGAGRQNTYLVSMADNKIYKALGEPGRPFPEDDERARINEAFEKLFTVLRDRDVLAKAMALFQAA